jgi:aminoglycoside 3-N-acetyltransferase
LLPLKRLSDDGGSVLLLGCGLASCTALHLAEERAGRRAFIRWIKYSDGLTRRVWLNGCSDGFVKLAPSLESVARRARIGSCETVAYPLGPLVDRAAQVMRRSPHVTLCSENGGQGCSLCVDAIKGGPIDKTKI